MKLDLPTIVTVAAATALALGAATNLLAVLFRALKMPGAVAAVTRYGAFAHLGADIVVDIASHPNADGAKAALVDLDRFAQDEPQLAVISARVKALLRVLGVTLALFVLLGCSGASSLPVCASWSSTPIGKGGAIPVCERWESPPAASAAPSTSASASAPEGK
jgi:hypothetical protein